MDSYGRLTFCCGYPSLSDMGQLGGGNSLTRSFLDYKPLFLIRKAKIVRKRGKIRDWGAFQPIISVGPQIFPFLIVLIRIFSHFGYTSPHLSNSLFASNFPLIVRALLYHIWAIKNYPKFQKVEYPPDNGALLFFWLGPRYSDLLHP